jgi:PAS domain S-box-containing protein
MLEGVAYCQMLFDEAGQPADWIYLEVNPAFEALTGLRGAAGKRVTQLIPGVREANPELFEIYGRVAETGVPEQFETYLPALERWLSVTVYRAQAGHFAAIFENITEQRHAEEELRAANERIRQLFDANVIGVIIAGSDGAIFEANDYFLDLIGHTRDELERGEINWRAITPPEWLPVSDHAIGEIQAAGTSRPYEKEYLRADGIRVPVLVVVTGFSGPDELIAAFVLDNTERKREAAERDRLAAVVEQSLDAIVIVDTELRVAYANPAFAAGLGWSATDMVGRGVLEVLDGVLEATTITTLVKVASSGESWLGEFDRRLADGTVGPVQVRVAPRLAADGKVEEYVVVVRDVAELRSGEAERARLSTAIEQSAEAVVITDTNARIEYVNPAFERVSGYTRDEVLGQNPRILKSGVQGPAFYAAMWAALTNGRSFVGDMTNRRKDGTLFQEAAVISPVRGPDGTTTSYVSVNHDVTRQRTLEAAWERQARERALISGALGDLEVQPTPTATAEAICRQVVSLAGLATATLLYFSLDGPAMPLGFVRADGVPVPLRRLPFRRSEHLREQAVMGPWVEPWIHRPWHPYERLFEEMGVRANAFAPVRHGGQLIGLLIVSSAAANATSQLTESLPALLEFATIAGALVGPAIVDLTEVGSVRHRILKTIGAGLYHPVFQPIVDLASREIVGYEALTRFDSGQRPDLCFADAWSVDTGPALELATLGAAVAAARRLPAGLWLSLNVSPRLLVDPDRLNAVLWPSDRPIVLEITEHAVIEDYGAVLAAIRAIGHDVRLAVDDAGAGIANFGHIIELRPNIVKLDISLVRGVNADLGRQAMVVGMRHFALEAGCRLLAEGVETGAEADTVLALGVDLGQGYFFGHPERVEVWAVAGRAGEPRA